MLNDTHEKNDKEDKAHIIYIQKDKLIPLNINTQHLNKMINKNILNANTSATFIREYKCLIMENVTKLIEQDEYSKIKSVFISHLIVIFI